MKITLAFLFFVGFSSAQLLESEERSVYQNHPNLDYFDKISKKRTNKSLYQLAHESLFAMDSAKGYTLSGRELRAVNMIVSNVPGVLDKDPFLESVYIYKLNSEVLYICIGPNENEYYMKKSGVFDNSSKKRGKGMIRGGGGGEYLVNLKTMSVIEKKSGGDK